MIENLRYNELCKEWDVYMIEHALEDIKEIFSGGSSGRKIYAPDVKPKIGMNKEEYRKNLKQNG